MIDVNTLSAEMFGRKRLETNNVSKNQSPVVMSEGTAVTESKDGWVTIKYGDAAEPVDPNEPFPIIKPTIIKLPTTTKVHKGDKVLISKFGVTRDNKKQLAVTGVAGAGDKMDLRIKELRLKGDELGKKFDSQMTNAERLISEMRTELESTKGAIKIFKDEAEVTYAKNTTVDAKTNALKETIEATYIKKDDANTKYAEKTEVTKSVDSITATVEANYHTFQKFSKEQQETNTNIQNGIQNVTSDVTNYKKINDEELDKIKAKAESLTDTVNKNKTSVDSTIDSLKSSTDDIDKNLTKLKKDTANKLQNLQNIADAAIETWTMHGAPTIDNKPAIDWNTDQLKKQHQGDIYFDADTGRSYRWDGNVWVEIKNTDITKALGEVDNIKKTYATKSDLSVTKDSIKGEINETLIKSKQYTKDLVSTESLNRTSAIEASSNSIKQHVAESYTQKTEFDDMANNVNVFMNGTQSNLENITNKVDKAADLATKASNKSTDTEQKLEQYKTTVSNTYATKGELAVTNETITAEVSKRNVLETTIKDLKTNVETNYSTTADMNSKIEASAQSIKETVSKTYVSESVADEKYAQKAETKILSDNISSTVESIKSINDAMFENQSKIDQTASSIQFVLSTVDKLKEFKQESSEFVKILKAYIKFGMDNKGLPFMRMGSNQSKVGMVLTNDALNFKTNDNLTLISLNAATQSARMSTIDTGKYTIIGNEETFKIFYNNNNNNIDDELESITPENGNDPI